MVATINMMESAICHPGTWPCCMEMRLNITSGDVKGKREPKIAIDEFGCWKILAMKITARIMGIITRNCICCASCSELTMDPTAAQSVLYKTYPNRKYTPK